MNPSEYDFFITIKVKRYNSVFVMKSNHLAKTETEFLVEIYYKESQMQERSLCHLNRLGIIFQGCVVLSELRTEQLQENQRPHHYTESDRLVRTANEKQNSRLNRNVSKQNHAISVIRLIRRRPRESSRNLKPLNYTIRITNQIRHFSLS